MAWPCISRVCCLARFWNQLDKSDLAVPLTIHNYSDIEEQPGEEGADGGGGGAPPPPRIPTGGSSTTGGSRPPQAHPRAATALPISASAPSLQESLAAVKRPSKKAGGGAPHQHQQRKEPFAAETQYQEDFRAWPVQKRDALPWIGESRRLEAPGAPPGTAPVAAPAVAAPAPAPSSQAGLPGGSHVYVLPTAGQEVGSKYSGFKQGWPSSSPPGVRKTTSSYRHEYRPWTGAKRSRPTKTTQGFIIPEDHFAQESSYKADFKIPEVKAKFSPNPSAVFQAPSRILNV